MIEDYISSNALKNAHPTDWLANLVSYFQRNIHNGEHIVFTLCGYYLGEKNILTTNTSVPNNIRSITEKAGLLYSGETILLSHLVNSDLAAFDYAKFTMQDSIDFLRFLIKTVSGLMHFGQMIPTVSYDCDVLALFSNEACWIEHSELH